MGDETFLCTYGDGIADVDIDALLKFHRAHGKLATVTATQPMSRFGVIDLEQDGAVAKFREKPKTDDWINIGYFIFEPGVFDYLEGDETVLEDKPLLRLAEDRQIAAFPHHGFWQPMDTFRESQLLNNLWNSGNPPWKVWAVKKKIAVIIPAYNESECVDELAQPAGHRVRLRAGVRLRGDHRGKRFDRRHDGQAARHQRRRTRGSRSCSWPATSGWTAG